MISAKSADMNVADYCAAMDRSEIVVNSTYQRSDRVWPDSARSYLIESILLGFPVPKFYLHVITDPKNRKSFKEIVDGQQRSRTIRDFLNDKLALSKTLDTEELRGLRYSTLPEDWQGKFLSYMLSVDQFIAATSADVRQVFRRMNSYTVPLNPEELRNADHQGPFKWFIHRIGETYSERLRSLGAFSDKDLIRMQDLKFYTEIASALDVGVSTTSRKNLDNLYRKYDETFPNEQEMQTSIDAALSVVAELSFLKNTNLMKTYQLYSLVLALVQTRDEQGEDGVVKLDTAKLEAGLLELSSALELSEDEQRNSPHRAFIEASAERTNVKDQRERRIAAYKSVIAAAVVGGE